jgi:hypothetical protein
MLIVLEKFGKINPAMQPTRFGRLSRLTALGTAPTIAQPFMAGSDIKQSQKSRKGRQKTWWPFARTFRPSRDFGKLRVTNPSHKWLG